MIQRSVILLLIMVVWVGCGEEDLGSVAKVSTPRFLQHNPIGDC